MTSEQALSPEVASGLSAPSTHGCMSQPHAAAGRLNQLQFGTRHAAHQASPQAYVREAAEIVGVATSAEPRGENKTFFCCANFGQ